jgi:antitoxin HigA-1
MRKSSPLTDDIRRTKRVTMHPGEMLKHEFLEPLGLSATALAAEIGVPANRLTEMVAGRRSLTADTALRLASRFGTTPEFWMNLQSAHDLSRADVAAAGRKTRAA